MTSIDVQPFGPAALPGANRAGAGLGAFMAQRRAALIAGIGYLLIFGLAGFANFVAREGLVVAGSAELTADNIARSQTLFRFGVAGFLAIFLIDIVVAWALHLLLRLYHHDLSLVAAWSRLAYTVMLGVAAVYLLNALLIYQSAPLVEVVGEVERNAQALVALELFNAAWMIGLAAFGLHLILLGILMARFAVGPRLLAIGLMVAGVAYLVDTTAYIVLVNYADHADTMLKIVAAPSILAEGWFGLWLLTRAGRQSPAVPPPGVVSAVQ